MKKLLAFVLFLVLAVVLFRYPLMRAAGSFLIDTDDVPSDIPVLFVLSGSAIDRGLEAARLYDSVTVRNIICTGENTSGDLRVFFGDTLTESVITRQRILDQGVPDSLVHVLKKGTSTMEESDAVLQYCRENGIGMCTVLSSSFHTRRVKRVFRKKMKDAGIGLTVLGAPSLAYDERYWWRSEYGLLALNNEYVKLIYYRLKY